MDGRPEGAARLRARTDPEGPGREPTLVDSVAMRIALALALAAAACQRPQPSPEYQEARELHAALVARAPLDASTRPEMDQVLALLERVPPGSADAEPAAALRRRILDERRAAAEEQARRARLVDQAGAPTPDVGGGAVPGGTAAPPAGAGPATAAPPPSALAAGTTLEEFQRAHGDCFEPKAAARIGQRQGAPLDGVAWGLRDDEACRRGNPAEVGRLVLFAGGTLREVREAADAKPVPTTRAVAGTVKPDGTVALPPGTVLPPGATVKWAAPPAPAAPPATRR